MNGATLIGIAALAAFTGLCWLLYRIAAADPHGHTPWDDDDDLAACRRHDRQMRALADCTARQDARHRHPTGETP